MAAKILIIEDEAKIARFVELELLHEGYEADKAGDGRTGLDMALQGGYDLILLDVMLIKKIRKKHGKKTEKGKDQKKPEKEETQKKA